MKTTNYYNTFIHVADDCLVGMGESPLVKDSKITLANLQFELLINNPYKYTSDDVLFFSKSQACLRSSPLAKRYGWGFHFNEEGKIALYGRGTNEYKRLSEDENLKQVKAMRNSRINKL